MKNLLFISNGHGEDIVTAQIIRHIDTKGLKIDVLPIVGSGKLFEPLKVNIIGDRLSLPGGGFSLRNFSFLIKDLFSGYLLNALSQARLLREKRGRYDLVVGVGDIVPLLYSMMTKCRFMLIGVNKSQYYKKLAFNYTGLEKNLLRKYCSLLITRDQKTAQELKKENVNALYLGNPMMDVVRSGKRGKGQGIRGKKTVGFLPGTRDDAYKNIEDFAKIASQIGSIDKRVKFILSFPSSLSRKKLLNIKFRTKHMITDDFNKILSHSRLVIGLSGTGNEQAAGLGIPVIAFPGRGAQYNYKFARGQKELLSDALLLLPRDSKKIASSAVQLLKNKRLMASMGRTGKERMGKPGASKKIATTILSYLHK